MTRTFGDFNPALTKAINRLARADTSCVHFVRHAEKAMSDDDFDHMDVLTCLRQGKAFGPEDQNGQLRANVIHRGRHIRVSVGSLEHGLPNWKTLGRLTVVTVMREV